MRLTQFKARCRLPLVGLMLLVLTPAAWASTPVAAVVESPLLTLEESVRIALEESPRVQVAESQERQSHAQLSEAKSVLNPSLSVSGKVERGHLSQADILANDPSSQANLALSYNQVIARTEGIRLAIEQGELGLRAAELQKEAEKLAVVSAVVNGYVSVIEAQSAWEVSRILARNSQEGALITADRVKVGTATQADLIAAEAAEARARQGEVVARDSVQLAHDALFQTIGLDVTARFGAETLPTIQPIDDLSGLFSVDESLDSLSNRALQSRTEVLQAEVALKTARYNLQQFHANSGPRSELTGSYSWVGENRSFSFSLSDRGELGVGLSQAHRFESSTSPTTEDVWKVGAGVSWNFADGGVRQSRGEQLAEQVKQAELRLANVRSGLSTELASRYNDVVHAMQEMAIADQDVLEAQARYQAMRHQFENGSSTQVEVWQSEAELVRARHDRVTATGRLIRAYTALATATGHSAEELVDLIAGPGGTS